MYKASETMSPACTLEETLQWLNVSAGKTFRATLFRSKTSGRKLLFLEAGKDFVNVLLRFLLLPVGTILHMLTKGPSEGMGVKPVPIGISSIFESVQSFSVSDLQVVKTHLTQPRAALTSFVKENTTFIVTDNLEITPLTTKNSVDVLSKLNVNSLADLEGNDITVSSTQILQLLHSALTSNTCLNEVFGKSK